MAQSLLYEARACPPLEEHDRSESVPEIVEGDVRNPRCPHQRLEVPGVKVAGVHRRADSRGEDEAILAPPALRCLPLLGLELALVSESLSRLLEQYDPPALALPLGRGELRASAYAGRKRATQR
jgi:hypothetical protein